MSGMNRVYLDHNATAPLLPSARAAMEAAIRRAWGNPSSPHAFGHEARVALEEARETIAGLVGSAPAETILVSGGTEADNLAILGVACARERAIGSPGHVITSAVEHPAVLEPCRRLESAGWRLSTVPVDRQGRIDPAAVASELRPDTALVSIMAANNETGVIQPIEAIAAIGRETGIPVHVDAVQAVGRIPVAFTDRGISLLSISAHKIGGPVGIGALVVRDGTPLDPLVVGGGQEGRRRPGTEPVMLAIGFAAAATAAREGLASEPARLAALRDGMERRLAAAIDGIRFNGSESRRLPNTSSMTIPGVDAESLVITMDLEGFAISTGSACSTGAARASHVLRAMGLSPEDLSATIRVSLGHGSTRDGIDAFADALPAAVAKCRLEAAGERT